MSDQRADEPLGADKQPLPRVAPGVPVLPAGATLNYNDCHIGHIGDNHHHYHASSGPAAVAAAAEYTERVFAAGADDVTITFTRDGTVTLHAKRNRSR